MPSLRCTHERAAVYETPESGSPRAVCLDCGEAATAPTEREALDALRPDGWTQAEWPVLPALRSDLWVRARTNGRNKIQA